MTKHSTDADVRHAYLWKIVMAGGQVVEFEGGNTSGAAAFVEDVQNYHLTGIKPDKPKNFRFPRYNHSTELVTDILVDIAKVQMVMRCPLEANVSITRN